MREVLFELVLQMCYLLWTGCGANAKLQQQLQLCYSAISLLLTVILQSPSG